MNDFICKEITTGYFHMVAVANNTLTMQRVLFEKWLLLHLKENLDYVEPGITLLYLKDLPLDQNMNNHLMYTNFLFSRSFLIIIERGIFFLHVTPKNFAVIRWIRLRCIPYSAE